MIKMPKDSVVGIYVDGKRQGTGTVVGDGRVITCLHVISKSFQSKEYSKFHEKEKPESLKIEAEYNGKKYYAQIVRGNQHHDLCLLNVKELDAPPLTIAPISYAPKEDEKVFSIGLPNGYVHSSEGKITRLDKIKSGEPPLIFNDTSIEPGCSGGALLNESGNLIGIQGIRDASIPHLWIHELLSRDDKEIVSRSQKPETEIDYYCEAMSGSKVYDLKPLISSFVKWVLDRPESEFAARTLVESLKNHNFDPKVAKSDDYRKVIEVLESHNPKTMSRYKWLKQIVGAISYEAPHREKYLLKTLEAAENNKQKAGIYLVLGEQYLYKAKDPQRAMECFEKMLSLMDGTNEGLSARHTAYDHLCGIYLANGDREKAQQAFIGAFEMTWRESAHFTGGDYDVIFELTKGKMRNKLDKGYDIQVFDGAFAEKEILRRCVSHIKKIFPSASELGT